MIKYLKGEPLKFKFAGKDMSLPCPLVADFDLINLILRGYGSATLESQRLKSEAVMALADRLIERNKLPDEIFKAIEANTLAFYFQFGIELDLYLPALFPKTEDEGSGVDIPLAAKS